MTATLPAPCDSAILDRAERQSQPHPRWTLIATILASSLAFIDGSVVNVALPEIGRSLDADAAGLQWTVNAYLLPLSALLLLGGAVGDQMGRRRMLIAGGRRARLSGAVNLRGGRVARSNLSDRCRSLALT